jgi:hypothetical protein
MTVPATDPAHAPRDWRQWLRARRAAAQPRRPAPVIYRWDLDKTYLKSDFESLRKMVKVPFERAEDKVDEPGVVALIRALKRSARVQQRDALVYFISASPPQIGRAIREKLDLDGIEADGIVFKNQLHHLVRGRFRYLREQVGFKLAELLKARAAAPEGALEFLFGDDWESDPLIYSLYADVVAGHLDLEALADILVRLRIDPARLVEIRRLSERVPRADVVRRIFINLERRTPPGRFRAFGERLVPTFNYFQTAVMLHEDGMLPLAAVAEVGRSLMDRSGYRPEELRNSLDDLRRRGFLPAPRRAALARELAESGILPIDGGRTGWARRLWRRWRERSGGRRLATLDFRARRVDYARLVDAWLAHGGRPSGEAGP